MGYGLRCAWLVAGLTGAGVAARAQRLETPRGRLSPPFAPARHHHDRPAKTDSPFTLNSGHLQLEFDVGNLTVDRADGWGRTTTYEVAPATLRIGLSPSVELQLVFAPYESMRIEDGSGAGATRRSGIGDVTPRLKFNLAGNDGGKYAVALLPYLTLPTARRGLGDGAVSGGIGIPVAIVVPGWDLGVETALDAGHGDGAYHLSSANSISIGRPTGGALEPHVEWYQSTRLGSGATPVGTVDLRLTARRAATSC